MENLVFWEALLTELFVFRTLLGWLPIYIYENHCNNKNKMYLFSFSNVFMGSLLIFYTMDFHPVNLIFYL